MTAGGTCILRQPALWAHCPGTEAQWSPLWVEPGALCLLPALCVCGRRRPWEGGQNVLGHIPPLGCGQQCAGAGGLSLPSPTLCRGACPRLPGAGLGPGGGQPCPRGAGCGGSELCLLPWSTSDWVSLLASEAVLPLTLPSPQPLPTTAFLLFPRGLWFPGTRAGSPWPPGAGAWSLSCPGSCLPLPGTRPLAGLSCPAQERGRAARSPLLFLGTDKRPGEVSVGTMGNEVTEPRAPPSLWPHWLDQGDLLEGQGWWAKAEVIVWGPQPELATSAMFLGPHFKIWNHSRKTRMSSFYWEPRSSCLPHGTDLGWGGEP